MFCCGCELDIHYGLKYEMKSFWEKETFIELTLSLLKGFKE